MVIYADGTVLRGMTNDSRRDIEVSGSVLTTRESRKANKAEGKTRKRWQHVFPETRVLYALPFRNLFGMPSQAPPRVLLTRGRE